ncbi:hypothetical protein HW090_02045 [Pseudomonas sp. ABC1]|uniref:hypothetical protein n=1 Tax=Pseudomonas sp. ABC1 TaxID=2748080 RepID=UPI0015C3AD4F|nr:hypothetical protein [Pseudomonas sp. ABC1]QLF92051.1 hypothetical protein HW090_02045 [Pseudomonas sp. ABC1]
MQKIMRYLSKQKLEWLLADKGLYVSAAQNQSDTEEGTSDHTFLAKHIAANVEGVDAKLLTDIDKIMLGMQKVGRETNYLSCWYLGTEESESMWEEFGKDGIILISTEWELMSAFSEPLEQALNGYPVTYSDELKASPLNEPLRVKHAKFQSEKEFRVVFNLTHYSILTGFEGIGVYVGNKPSHLNPQITACMSQKGIEQGQKVIRRKDAGGLVLDFDFARAIIEVRVHPQATDEDLLDVQTRLLGIGVKCPVKHSDLRQARPRGL